MTVHPEHTQLDCYTVPWRAVKRRKHSPFAVLPGESPADAARRYTLFGAVWRRQLGAIEALLDAAHTQLFDSLAQYARAPVSEKLDVMFLCLSSNSANNLRVVDDFAAKARESEAHCFVARLNSKACVNVKTSVRLLIAQFVQAPHDDTEEEVDSDEETLENDAEKGRVVYDFEIVNDWAAAYQAQTACTNLRLLVVVEDTDSFDKLHLLQLVQLLAIYAKRLPIKVVLTLSTSNVGDWIASHIVPRLRRRLACASLHMRDNRAMGFSVIDHILLKNEISAETPLLLDAKLSLIILNRFNMSNNSIDSIVTELRLTYMVHFYLLSLAVLVDPAFVPTAHHCAALRKLPSFKKYMEFLAHEGEAAEALAILDSDDKVRALLAQARVRFQKYQNAVMNAVHLLHALDPLSKHKFELYKMITNNQLANSMYVTDVIRQVRKNGAPELKDVLEGGLVRREIKGITDDDVIKLELSDDPEVLANNLTVYLHHNRHLNMKISDNLFNEVLTVSGSDETDHLSDATLEENYDNLVINLLRPKHRLAIEAALDEPETFLRSPHLTDSKSPLHGPILCRLYQVYKEAPVNIGLWDFFEAVKLSLNRNEVIREMEMGAKEKGDSEVLELVASLADDATWTKWVYLCFVQSCFELMSMGFMRQKVSGDYAEKLVWKNV